jgi:hypothetical protein
MVGVVAAVGLAVAVAVGVWSSAAHAAVTTCAPRLIERAGPGLRTGQMRVVASARSGLTQCPIAKLSGTASSAGRIASIHTSWGGKCTKAATTTGYSFSCSLGVKSYKASVTVIYEGLPGTASTSVATAKAGFTTRTTRPGFASSSVASGFNPAATTASISSAPGGYADTALTLTNLGANPLTNVKLLITIRSVTKRGVKIFSSTSSQSQASCTMSTTSLIESFAVCSLDSLPAGAAWRIALVLQGKPGASVRVGSVATFGFTTSSSSTTSILASSSAAAKGVFGS